MFFFQWDPEAWKQSLVVLTYVGIGIAGIVYVLLDSSGPRAFVSGLADIGGALFLLALVTEGAVWTMVMALGKIREARDRGREEGRQEGLEVGLEVGRKEGLEAGRTEERTAMMQALRDAGIPEQDIQRVQDQRNSRDNGSRR